eukprot:Gb_10128 [translate_table: standard]
MLEQYLRGYIVRTSNNITKHFTWLEEDRQPKIRGFERRILIPIRKQKIFRLQISMHNTQRMACLHHTHNSSGQLSSLPLTVMTPLNNPIKQFSTSTQFHHQMNRGHILVSPLYSNHIGVLRQMMHYLNLSPHILNIFNG